MSCRVLTAATDHACSSSQTAHPLAAASASPNPPSTSALSCETANARSSREEARRISYVSKSSAETHAAAARPRGARPSSASPARRARRPRPSPRGGSGVHERRSNARARGTEVQGFGRGLGCLWRVRSRRRRPPAKRLRRRPSSAAPGRRTDADPSRTTPRSPPTPRTLRRALAEPQRVQRGFHLDRAERALKRGERRSKVVELGGDFRQSALGDVGVGAGRFVSRVGTGDVSPRGAFRRSRRPRGGDRRPRTRRRRRVARQELGEVLDGGRRRGGRRGLFAPFLGTFLEPFFVRGRTVAAPRVGVERPERRGGGRRGVRPRDDEPSPARSTDRAGEPFALGLDAFSAANAFSAARAHASVLTSAAVAFRVCSSASRTLARSSASSSDCLFTSACDRSTSSLCFSVSSSGIRVASCRTSRLSSSIVRSCAPNAPSNAPRLPPRRLEPESPTSSS